MCVFTKKKVLYLSIFVRNQITDLNVSRLDVFVRPVLMMYSISSGVNKVLYLAHRPAPRLKYDLNPFCFISFLAQVVKRKAVSK